MSKKRNEPERKMLKASELIAFQSFYYGRTL